MWERSERAGDGPARTVTLKLKFADFRQITRSRTTEQTVHDRATLDRLSAELLDAELPPPLGIRLMGVTLSGFSVQEAEPVEELPLFAGA